VGYDLHVTRADYWLRNQDRPIGADEWLTVVNDDPELTPDPEFGRYSVTWSGKRPGQVGWFDWHDGNVFTTDPSRATVSKLLTLAERLKAMVQGDDGEVYESLAQWHRRV
jgi:hypothetical protein